MEAAPTRHIVERVRQLMQQQKLDALVVPTGDPHLSEYVPPRFARREYLTGFTGSAGTAVVTHTQALLWTDGRYHLQAGKQLEEGVWTLMKAGLPEVPTMSQWLTENMDDNAVVGVDPWVTSVDDWQQIRKTLDTRRSKNLKLQGVEGGRNLVDVVWSDEPTGSHQAMPPSPAAPIQLHPILYSGKNVESKLADVAEKLRSKSADKVLYAALDDVAWLLNLRGNDIPYNPVFMSYCIVDAEGHAALFTESSRIQASPEELRAHFGPKVVVKPYEEVATYLAEDARAGGGKPLEYLYDGRHCNMRLQQSIEENPNTTGREQESWVTEWKAQKNDVELAGMRACHIRDAAALIQYLVWLEDSVSNGEKVTEITGAARLEQFRQQQDLFVSLSFPTISSVGPNAACIHYRPTPESDSALTDDQVYLVDSGGQYRDGTTDVTRTVHFGTPKPKEREAFTRVLKGHIALDRCIFPTGVTGHAIDSWARGALWEVGLDYGHGTGHGVGSFLNVHEGPMGISARANPLKTAVMNSRQVLSNEPGYYEDGSFGIRIENLAEVKDQATPYQFAGKQFLTFQALTLVPIQHKLIDVSLLSEVEVQWVDNYHKRVLEEVGPLLKTDGRVSEWLVEACKPLPTR